MKKFLGKIKNTDDRDCVKYIEINGFECNHYFGGIQIEGACFSGLEEKLKDTITNDCENFETILTSEELLRLFELDKELDNLGYGIEKDSDKYNKGLEILKQMENIISKLDSKENEDLFNKVINDEKQWCMNEYDLTMEEIDEVFDYYNLEYQDRGIISCVFNDTYDLCEEEKFALGYENMPYFNDDEFITDILESEQYLQLDSGKIISLNY